MKITATITNIAAQGLGLVAFAEFSNGETRSYKFEIDVDKKTIKQTIQDEVDALNSPIAKAETFKDLVGLTIE